MKETNKLILTLRRNGNPQDSGIKVTLPEDCDSVAALKELLVEEVGLSRIGDCKFFTEEGCMLNDTMLSLLKGKVIIYIEPDSRLGFNYVNILGEYEEGEALGKGGYGSVRRAVHRRTGQVVAIKYMDITKYLYNASLVEEIYRESNTMKLLNHPNIVKLYHAFLIQNYFVLIMEYVSGGDMRKLINDKKGLTEEETQQIFIQLVEAVLYCHNNGVVHRDLKPENILLTEEEPKKVKLIDFGIAGSQLEGSERRSTAGSLPYMPPEVLLKTKTESAPSIDVWALGVILFSTLFGMLPFRGKTEKDQVSRIISRPVSFRACTKSISTECKQLIEAMLEKDPSARISTSEVFQSDWLRFPYEKLHFIKVSPVKKETTKKIQEEDKLSPPCHISKLLSKSPQTSKKPIQTRKSSGTEPARKLVQTARKPILERKNTYNEKSKNSNAKKPSVPFSKLS